MKHSLILPPAPPKVMHILRMAAADERMVEQHPDIVYTRSRCLRAHREGNTNELVRASHLLSFQMYQSGFSKSTIGNRK